MRQVAAILEPVAASIKLVELPGLPPKGDIVDWIADGHGGDELRALIEAAPSAADAIATWPGSEPPGQGEALEQAVERLAQLTPYAYEQARLTEATKLGVRASFLDAMVKAKREALAPVADGQGRPLDLPDAEPWPDPVVGAELIGQLVAKIREFVALGHHDAVAVALWVIHAHGHDSAFHSTRLAVTSPTPRCGKSSLLRCIARLAPRPLATSNISAPALFRVIEKAKPTLLIDEIDQVDEEKRRELVGIVNSSQCRLDACVVRTVAAGDDHEPRAFSTWAPIALAAIGRLPITWVDRSIVIRLKRRAKDEPIERMRLDRDQGFERLGRMAARWAADLAEALRDADPWTPPQLNDRGGDNWRHALAIADQAGGDWPRLARAAAVALSGDDDHAEAWGVMVLGDVDGIFAGRGDPEQLFSAAIVADLTAMEGRPWPEAGKSKMPLSPNQLARLLSPFGIAPQGTIRIGDQTGKGYRREQFEEAWARYLSPARGRADAPAGVLGGNQTVTTSHATDSAASSDFQTVTLKNDVTVANRPKATATAGCDGVTDRNRGNGPLDVESPEMTLEDLDRMAGEASEDWGDFDAWIAP